MKKMLLIFSIVFCCTAVLPVQAQMTDKIVLYLPNRVMDILDIFTLNIGTGPVAALELHAAYGFRVGAGAGYTVGIVKDFNRQYGTEIKNGAFAFCGAGFEDMERRGGNSCVPNYWEHMAGIHLPTEKIFDRRTGARDYYDFGGIAGAGIVSIEASLHPVELLDMILGFFFIDIRNDDMTFEMFK